VKSPVAHQTRKENIITKSSTIYALHNYNLNIWSILANQVLVCTMSKTNTPFWQLEFEKVKHIGSQFILLIEITTLMIGTCILTYAKVHMNVHRDIQADFLQLRYIYKFKGGGHLVSKTWWDGQLIFGYKLYNHASGKVTSCSPNKEGNYVEILTKSSTLHVFDN
jgi:hypothetical protein